MRTSGAARLPAPGVGHKRHKNHKGGRGRGPSSFVPSLVANFVDSTKLAPKLATKEKKTRSGAASRAGGWPQETQKSQGGQRPGGVKLRPKLSRKRCRLDKARAKACDKEKELPERRGFPRRGLATGGTKITRGVEAGGRQASSQA